MKLLKNQHFACLAALLWIVLGACGSPEPEASSGPSDPGDPASDAASSETPPATATTDRVPFVDRTAETGLDFVHANGMTGRFYIVEVTAAGCGMADVDGDGDLDLYLPQGRLLEPGATPEDALVPLPDGPLLDRLYRNDLSTDADGRPVLQFTDVTEASGIVGDGYGMGVASGDYDHDGDVDLYVTQVGSNRLWRNRGDGTFTDATAAAGADDPRWSVPASFFDFDRDGRLDLFVGNYLDFSPESHKTCLSVTGAPDYCGPSAYRPVPDRLLANRSDGTFEDVTRRSGLFRAHGPALGSVAADFDLDGRLDLYVANDGQDNQMWMNRGDGTFEDRSVMAGTAVSGEGVPEGSMGVVAADFNADGADDLFMTHIAGETNTIYENQGDALFRDASIATGLGAPSKPATGFGTAAVDFDNDGLLDVVTVNGAVRTVEEQARRGDVYPLAQRNQIFRNLGGGRFEDLSDAAGEPFALEEVSRGLAYGDVDNDGDTDLLILNSNGPARLLINQVGQDRPWIGVRLLESTGTRDALGARVVLRRSGAPDLWRRVAGDGSFASANDPRVLFGLGDAPQADGLDVYWPSGRRETFPPPPSGRYTPLTEGRGTSLDSPGSTP